MITGDLVDIDGKRYLVGIFRRDVRTYMLHTPEGALVEMPDDMPHTVVCQPTKTWLFLSLKDHRDWGRITQVTLTSGRVLQPLVEWVPGNGSGGSIFISPSVGLKLGNTVVIHYAKGHLARTTIQRSFATLAQRVQKGTVVPKPPKTAFDRILEGFGTDDDAS